MIRVGVVGTNFISEWFTAAARRTGGRVEPVAVYSRSAVRAQEFAAANDIACGFGDYEEMLGEVDAVYIASPTSVHHSQALSAIEAGRHVLIEKTMTASLAEAEEVFAAAERKGVVAMEALRHVHTPEHQVLREAITQIGALRYAHIQMLQYSSRYDRFRAGEVLNAFDPSLGNSALADIGVYPLGAAVDLFGSPLAHSGYSVYLHNGFEGGGSIQCRYQSMIADVAYSKVVRGVTPSTIIGEDGAITVNFIAEPSHIERHTRDEVSVLFDGPPVRPADGMHHELLVFADQVEAGVIEPRWKNLTLEVRRIMDEHLAPSAP